MITCNTCGIPQSDSRFHKAAAYKLGRRPYCKTCRRKEAKKYFRDNKPARIAAQRIVVQNIKRETFSHYGRVCRCCQENELSFLSLDHIKDVRGNDGRGYPFYIELKRLGFPRQGELQVLCMNCQLGKRIGRGFCPHHPRKDLRL